MYFRYVVMSVMLSVSLPILAWENLQLEDFYDTWMSEEAVVSGEKQRLIIKSDESAVFSRSFTDHPEQVFNIKCDNFHWINGIVILDFDKNKLDAGYKLVLSGWKSDNTKVLYGILYMYRNGLLFNGIHVYFEGR